MNIEFDIRKISWAHFSQMQVFSPAKLLQNRQNEDNVRLDDLPVLGISDLAEVNLGILLGFRSENGLRVRFKSPFENRELFVRISARIDHARRHQIPVSVGGAYRMDGSFYAVHLKVGGFFYDLLKQTEKYSFNKTRVSLAQMERFLLAELATKRESQKAVRFSGQIISFSGLGSDYSYVLLGCITAPEGETSPQIEVVFAGKNVDRDKFVDINAALDWACEKKISVEFGGDFNGEYFNAVYFKIKPDSRLNLAGELISLQ